MNLISKIYEMGLTIFKNFNFWEDSNISPRKYGHHSTERTYSKKHFYLPFFFAAIFFVTSFFQIKANNVGEYNVLNFGARPDGKTDNTLSFQKAIDAATKSGGIVLVPVGKYLIAGSLKLSGVSIKGQNLSPKSWFPLTGSIIMATGGKGNESAPPLFDMRTASTITGLTVYYPEQDIDHIVPYPFTFRIGGENLKKEITFDCTIENITLINSYNGIKAGPTENGRHRINSVFGCVLRRGISVESVGDIGRIENIQFHCHFWASKEATKGDFWKAFKYMQNNLEAFIIGRSDWEYMTNTFVFPAKIGYHFINTHVNPGWEGGCNGQFSGIAADASGCCIKVEGIQPMGLLITNGQFNSHLTGDSTQIIISPGCEGNVRFVNCGFWGPVKHNALIQGDGFTSFSDCYFSNNYFNSNFYSVVAERGKIQITNCTFDGAKSVKVEERDLDKIYPSSIWLKENVKHAIISGNNGYKGVLIKNDIAGKAIIERNEPFEK